MSMDLPPAQPHAREGLIQVDGARLFYREVGRGQAAVVLHGGPDFDHTYLLPEMDLLADGLHLIYYDQRGRGRSAAGVQAAGVTLASEVGDLERVREHFGLAAFALLGHSWGALLALEYATSHPERVSHLILMNTAPASRDDWMLHRNRRTERWPGDVEQLAAMAAADRHREGDPDAVAERYRVHFRSTLRQPGHLDMIVARLRASFTPGGILLARAIEERLVEQTWSSEGYDLLPRLRRLYVPALVIHGEDDLVPPECALHIAQALRGSRFVLLPGCGHFSYLERPEEVGEEVAACLRRG